MTRKSSTYLKVIFTIAIPVTAQRLVEFALIMTDSFFIGTYNPAGYSAINNVFMPYFMLFSFFFAISQGVTIMVSQQIGAKRKHLARRFTETAFFFNCLLSFGYLLFWQVLGSSVLKLMGARGEILGIGKAYLGMLSLQFISAGIGITANASLQADGKTLPGMISTIIKVGLNIFLDWVLIFGKLGFPELGIMGAGIGTAVSAIAGDAFIAIWFFKLKHFRVRLSGILQPVPRLFGSILRLGIPVGMEYFLWTAGQTVMTGFINRYDTVSSGYFLLLTNFLLLAMSLFDGIGVAGLVLIGQATGAKKPREARYAASYALVLSQLVCTAGLVAYLGFPEQMLSIYLEETAVIQFLVPLLRFYGFACFFKALNIISGNSIRGTGNTIWMLYTQVGGTIFIIATSALFIFGLELGLFSLLLAATLDEALRSIVNKVKFYHAQNRLIRLQEENTKQP